MIRVEEHADALKPGAECLPGVPLGWVRRWDHDGLTRRRAALHGGRVSLLLPQTRAGTVRSATPVSIHGDRYVDLVIALEGETGPPAVGRVGADDCPGSLTPGERVSVRFTVGVMVRVTREVG